MQNRFYLFTFALIFIVAACQRSQFSTSSRHLNNGKVSYSNSYKNDKRIFSKRVQIKNQVIQDKNQSLVYAAQKTISPTVILKTDSDKFTSEPLIASASKGSAAIRKYKFDIISIAPRNIPHIDVQHFLRTFSTPDTSREDSSRYYRAKVNTGTSNHRRKSIPFSAIIGFICVLTGLGLIITSASTYLALVTILLLSGIILGFITTYIVGKHHERYAGMGFGLLIITLGFLGIIALFILLSFLI